MNGPLAGTGHLIALHWRAGWRALVGWPALMTLIVVATGRSITALYSDAADRLSYAQTAGLSPAAAAFNGRGYDLHTLGGITSVEVGFMALLLFPVIGIHLAIRFTRRDEESGLAELLTSAPVGRLAPVVSAALAVGAGLALYAGATTAGLVAIGLPWEGAVLYSAASALFTGAFVGVGLVTAQLCEGSRTAYALSLSFSLAMFLVRAVVDGRSIDAVWLSPMGWLAEVRPWGDDAQAWPLASFTLAGLALLAASVGVATRRDLGAGLIAPRPGPARASASLGTAFGLAWRLTRGMFAGWTTGLVAWAAALGILASEMTDIVAANPGIAEALGIDAPEQLVTSLAALVGGLGLGALGLSGVQRLVAEEDAGRLGLLTSTPVSRTRLWSAWALMLAAQVTVAGLVASITLGAASRISTGNEAALADGVRAGMTYVVPVLFLIALALAGTALHRRLIGLAWGLLGWAAVVALLAEPLDLPEWARHASVFDLVGLVPIDPVETSAMTALCAGAVALGLTALTTFTRRDLRAG
ncbi:MAG: hypothetical protein Q4G51_01800 [Dermatophilus congolensis]|nr:hypothetical protein [Dermatophilus congolensis]